MTSSHILFHCFLLLLFEFRDVDTLLIEGCLDFHLLNLIFEFLSHILSHHLSGLRLSILLLEMLVKVIYNGIWIIILAHLINEGPKDPFFSYDTLSEVIELTVTVRNLLVGLLWLGAH